MPIIEGVGIVYVNGEPIGTTQPQRLPLSPLPAAFDHHADVTVSATFTMDRLNTALFRHLLYGRPYRRRQWRAPKTMRRRRTKRFL